MKNQSDEERFIREIKFGENDGNKARCRPKCMAKIAPVYNVLIIGYPLNMNYKENSMTEIIDKFKCTMEENNFEVHLEDERLSSEYAKKIMVQQDIKTGEKRDCIKVLLKRSIS